MLGKNRTHEQATITSTHESELTRIGVFLVDQVLAGGRKVIKDILFLGQVTRLMPFLTELSAAANVSDDIDSTAIKPGAPSKIKIRRHTQPVAAISVKQSGIIPIQFRPFAPQNVERNLCSILKKNHLANHFDIGEKNEQSIPQSCQPQSHVRSFNLKPRNRFGITHVAKK